MNKIKALFDSILQFIKKFVIVRKNIGIRFIFFLFFIIVWSILDIVLFILVLFQFIFLFIFTKHSESIKTLSHKLTVYFYRVLRYVTFNENLKPYPFSKFPEIIEPADDTDLSVPMPEDEPESKEDGEKEDGKDGESESDDKENELKNGLKDKEPQNGVEEKEEKKEPIILAHDESQKGDSEKDTNDEKK